MQALQKEVGRRIKQLRERKGLSQEALAGICNLHRTYVGLIERGERNVSVTTVDAIAQGLGVPPAELFAGVDAPLPAIAPANKNKAPMTPQAAVDAHLVTIRQILISNKLTTERDYQSLFKKNHSKET